jgi:hypothetical protein
LTWPGGIFVNGATCGGLSIEALPVARDEIAFMIDLCDDHPPNTLVAISRTLTDAGVSERWSWLFDQFTANLRWIVVSF